MRKTGPGPIAWIAACALAGAAAVLFAADGAPEKPAPAAKTLPPWSIYRGGLERTGEIRTTGVPEFHGVKWKFKVGDKPQDTAWSYPLIADGAVFSGSNDNTRGTQKYMHAVDVETGKERWKFPVATAINGRPALEDVQGIHCLGDGLLYFTGEGGYTYAVDVKAGKEAWKRLSMGDVTLYDGLLYHAGGKGVYSADPAMGEKRPWQFKIAEPVAQGPFAVADGILYFGANDWNSAAGTLYAVEIATGKELWRFQPPGGGMKTLISGGNIPVVSGGTVFIGATKSEKFYALDAKTGKEKWSAPVEKGTLSAAAVAEGSVFLIDLAGNLRALSAADGAERWKTKTGREIISDPIVVEGVVYCSSMRRVFAISAKDGAEKWHFDAEGFVWSALNAADGVLYFGDWKGWLYAIH